MTIQPYDRAAAVAYARRWALARNPAYYDFERIGGDCTNFASQCLFAGARVMNPTPTMGWYYYSVNNRAPAWSGVEQLHRFLVNNRSIGPIAREVAREQAAVGDIVQLAKGGDYYHSPVIVAVEPTILVAAHSYDALDRPLDSYTYDSARFLHIEGVRRA